jgi:enamine deaminase RidA (YjgF/YER057c/UK114 family)
MATSARHPLQRTVLEIPGVPAPPGWSQGVAAGGWVFVAGTMATDFAHGLATEARVDPQRSHLQDPLELQSRRLLGTIGETLRAGGCDIRRDVLRIWQWAPSQYPSAQEYEQGRERWPRFRSATPYARVLKEMVGDPRRSSTGIGVRQLPIPDALMCADLIAAQPRSGVEKQAFRAPEGVPQPEIGYSPATRWGDWVFLAGFGATDFRGDWLASAHMGEPGMVAPEARVNPYIWLGSEIEAQTDYTLRMMSRIAEAAGTSFDRCVKADVTIAHPRDFLAMDRVWRAWFPHDPPARNVVTGAQLVVKGLRVEIALQFLAGDSPLSKRSIRLTDVPTPAGHAPHAVKAGDFLFLSSQLAIDHDGGVPGNLRSDPAMPYFRQNARRQTEVILERVAAICAAAGTSLANTCKVQAFLDDLAALPEMLDAWRNAFPSAPPALTCLGMGGPQPLLAPGSHVQLDCIVHAP